MRGVLSSVACWCTLAQLVRSKEECIDRIDCETQLFSVAESVRLRTVDALQREVEDTLGSAPSAIESTDSQLTDGLLQASMALERDELALLEHFWYQMSQFPDIDWLYYGDEGTGNFVGLRKAYPCEVAKNCQYTGGEVPATPRPDVAAGSLIRLSYSGANQTFYAHTTRVDGTTGSDKYQLLYSDPAFRTKERTWYKLGVGAGPNTPSNWTEPYLFSGGNYGVTVVRKVVVSNAFLGVLAGDYELAFLRTFAENLASGSAPSTALFFMTATKTLLANTLNVSVVNAGAPVKVDNMSSSDLIRKTSAEVYASSAALSDPAANWETVSNTTTSGEFVLASETWSWDAIAIFEMKWICVMVAKKVSPLSSGAACVGRTECRDDLLRLAFDYRVGTLTEFRRKLLAYTSSPLAAVSTVEATYNNGNLHAAWCDPCGQLPDAASENATEAVNLRNHLKHTLLSLPEVAWLYVGFLGAGSVKGYRRAADGTLQYWKSCDGTPATGCDSGTVLIDEATSQVVSTSGEDPTAKDWWTLPAAMDIGLNDAVWTKAYVFSTGEVGLSVVKRLLGGDWTDDTSEASMIVAADVSLAFLTGFVESLGVAASTYLFVMDADGRLLAANRGVPTTAGNSTLFANSSVDPTVKAAAAAVSGAGTIPEDWPTNLLADPTGNEYVMVDAIRLTAAEGQLPFSWTLVMATPESDLYDEDLFFEDTDDSTSVAPVVTIALVVLVVLALGYVAMQAFRKRMTTARFKGDPSASTSFEPQHPLMADPTLPGADPSFPNQPGLYAPLGATGFGPPPASFQPVAQPQADTGYPMGPV
ncbi:hypothetical protein DIPPA_22950 [Diplonema papillatum]|nr:hypothetical protein DIPPA_22950 [Diplonema papillatum]